MRSWLTVHTHTHTSTKTRKRTRARARMRAHIDARQDLIRCRQHTSRGRRPQRDRCPYRSMWGRRTGGREEPRRTSRRDLQRQRDGHTDRRTEDRDRGTERRQTETHKTGEEEQGRNRRRFSNHIYCVGIRKRAYSHTHPCTHARTRARTHKHTHTQARTRKRTDLQCRRGQKGRRRRCGPAPAPAAARFALQLAPGYQDPSPEGMTPLALPRGITTTHGNGEVCMWGCVDGWLGVCGCVRESERAIERESRS